VAGNLDKCLKMAKFDPGFVHLIDNHMDM
jgi:hypothetical protein